jgi:hypothetical protein
VTQKGGGGQCFSGKTRFLKVRLDARLQACILPVMRLQNTLVHGGMRVSVQGQLSKAAIRL